MSKKAPSPSAARLHPQAGPAPSPYQQRLDTVDATTRTADNILTVVSDPRKAWAVVILVGLVVVVYLLFRSSIKKGLTSLWDLLAAPFRQQRQETEREDTVQRLTGQSADYTLTPAQALAVADQLYGCINWTGDNEEGIYNILRLNVFTSGDWRLVCDRYGVRPYAKFAFKRTAGLETTLSDILNDRERATARDILTANNIDPNVIAF